MRGTFLIFLLQMAEGNIEMNSANENEDQSLMSDGANVPEQKPRAPPRDIGQEKRRVRRMNRHEREQREIACNRRREQPGRRSPERHRSTSPNRHRVHDRDARRIQGDVVQRHRDEHLPLRRSKLTSHMTIIAYKFNLFRLLQNGAIGVDGWGILKRNAEAQRESVQRRKSHSSFLTDLQTCIIDYCSPTFYPLKHFSSFLDFILFHKIYKKKKNIAMFYFSLQ